MQDRVELDPVVGGQADRPVIAGIQSAPIAGFGLAYRASGHVDVGSSDRRSENRLEIRVAKSQGR